MAEDKAAIRSAVRSWQRSADEAQLRRSDEALLGRFLALEEVERAKVVLLFYGVGAEPDTRRLLRVLLEQGKRVCLPRCLGKGHMEARMVEDPEKLVPHRYGMLEPDEGCAPVAKGEIDLALIPAMCFDTEGYRLGHGGGYYDRYLADFSGVSVGLCREALLRAHLPREEHDRPVELLVTERAVLRCAEAAKSGPLRTRFAE